jgi:hypothetical protein
VARYPDVGDWSSPAGGLYLAYLATSALAGIATLWLARREAPDDAPGSTEGRRRALLRP